jgi:hypothetical protein
VVDSELIWSLEVAHLDLIFVPGSATTEAIHLLIATSVDEFVHFSLFLSSLTLLSSPTTACERR